jgi:hypothetical protein
VVPARRFAFGIDVRSIGHYADVGIKSIMPQSGLCRTVGGSLR